MRGASVQVARGAGDTDTNEVGRRSGMIHSMRLVQFPAVIRASVRFAITGLYEKQRFTSKGTWSLSMW